MRQTRQEMFIHHISTIIHRSNLGRNSERVIQEKIKKKNKISSSIKSFTFLSLIYSIVWEWNHQQPWFVAAAATMNQYKEHSWALYIRIQTACKIKLKQDMKAITLNKYCRAFFSREYSCCNCDRHLIHLHQHLVS